MYHHAIDGGRTVHVYLIRDMYMYNHNETEKHENDTDLSNICLWRVICF